MISDVLSPDILLDEHNPDAVVLQFSSLSSAVLASPGIDPPSHCPPFDVAFLIAEDAFLNVVAALSLFFPI